MSILQRLFTFGVQVETVTLADVEEQVRLRSQPEYYPSARSDDDFVFTKQPNETEEEFQADMLVINSKMPALRNERFHQNTERKWEDLIASLPPIKRDPVTGEPIRPVLGRRP